MYKTILILGLLYLVGCNSSSSDEKFNEEYYLKKASIVINEYNDLEDKAWKNGVRTDFENPFDLNDSLISIYTKGLSQNPESIKLLSSRSTAYQSKGELDLAIKDIKTILFKIDSTVIPFYFGIGALYYKLGLKDSARRYYNLTIDKCDRFDFNNKSKKLNISYKTSKAYALIRLSKREDANKLMENLIKEYPSEKDQLERQYLYMKEFEEAQFDLE